MGPNRLNDLPEVSFEFRNHYAYSGTLPYDHLGNTVTSLLWPLQETTFSLAARQNGHTFSCKKTKTKQNPRLIRPIFLWPIGQRIGSTVLKSWYKGGDPNKDFGAISQTDLTRSLVPSVAQATASPPETLASCPATFPNDHL